MPYLIFVFGILIGGYALFRFFLSSSPEDIKEFIANALLGLLVLITLFLAMTGKIIPALIVVVLCFPFFVKYYIRKSKNDDEDKSED